MSRFRKPALKDFTPYAPGFQPRDGEGWIKLNTNESPFPPSPKVVAAIKEATAGLNLYPDPEQGAFRAAAAQAFDVSPEQVIAGNGGDELLAMAIRAFVPAGGRLAFASPSYSLMPVLAGIHEVELVDHPRGDDGSLPRSFYEDESSLKYVANPNSPTGDLLSIDVIHELCAGENAVVLVDEAYVDFAPHSALALVNNHPNLLLVRTMSKSFSLAGLRLGYAIGDAELIGDLMAVKDSYNVGRLQLVAGAAALGDLEYRDKCVAEIVGNRDRLAQELRRRGYDVRDSAANFVFMTTHRMGRHDTHYALHNGGSMFAQLFDRKILVRQFNLTGKEQWRISVGKWDQCQALLDALDDVSQKAEGWEAERSQASS